MGFCESRSRGTVTIYARVCCWMITRKTSVHPDRKCGAKPLAIAKTLCSGIGLKCGVWRLREAGMGHTEVGGGRVDERGLWGGYSSNSHINLPKTSYCISQKVYMGYG